MWSLQQSSCLFLNYKPVSYISALIFQFSSIKTVSKLATFITIGGENYAAKYLSTICKKSNCLKNNKNQRLKKLAVKNIG
jgi:hypothetical protein